MLGGRTVLLVNVMLRQEGEVNDLLVQAAARHPNAVLIDWWSLVTSEPGLTREDGYHSRGRRRALRRPRRRPDPTLSRRIRASSTARPATRPCASTPRSPGLHVRLEADRPRHRRLGAAQPAHGSVGARAHGRHRGAAGPALDPVAAIPRRRGLPRALVAAVTLLGFLLAVWRIVSLLVPAIVDEFSDLGPTLEDAVDDVEDWLVNDSPFDVSRQDIDDFRRGVDRITTSLESQSGTVVRARWSPLEVVTGVVLALIATFFLGSMTATGSAAGCWGSCSRSAGRWPAVWAAGPGRRWAAICGLGDARGDRGDHHRHHRGWWAARWPSRWPSSRPSPPSALRGSGPGGAVAVLVTLVTSGFSAA